jgi:hypothetical protein
MGLGSGKRGTTNKSIYSTAFSTLSKDPGVLPFLFHLLFFPSLLLPPSLLLLLFSEL